MPQMPSTGSHNYDMPRTHEVPAMPPRRPPPSLLPYKDDCIVATSCHGTLRVFGREIRVADPAWSHIIDGLRKLSLDLEDPDCHGLISGDVFLQGLMQEAWRLLQGRTQRLPGGEVIKWRRPQSTDGALAVPTETPRLEIRGIPFGMRSWQKSSDQLAHFGRLCNRLHTGDPNSMCMDMEMGRNTVVRRKLPVEIRERAGFELHIAVLSGLPLLPSCPHFASSSGSTARLAAPLVIQIRPQLPINETSISPALAQSATP